MSKDLSLNTEINLCFSALKPRDRPCRYTKENSGGYPLYIYFVDLIAKFYEH